MIPFYLVALFAHYMADFPGQAFFQKYMGKKNESKAHLTNHVFMYASIMLLVCMWFHLTFLMLAWVGLNAALHWLITGLVREVTIVGTIRKFLLSGA